MRIGIDARWVFGQASGIGVYTQELVKSLAAVDRENEYILYFDSDERRQRTVSECGLADAPRFACRLLPWGPFSAWNQLLLPGILKQSALEVFHSPNYMIPLPAFPRYKPGRVRCVVTIHDVIPLMFPRHAPKSRKSRLFPIYRRLMREVGMRADMIVTVSDASRRDVIRHLGIPPEREARVRTVYNGVSARFLRAGSAAAGSLQAGGGAEPRTVLYVGRLDPYKNCVGLVEAFALAKKACPFPLRLVVAGPDDPRYPEARQRAAELGILGETRWGYLPEDGLLEAYRTAHVLVLPSLYEGFGFPVLEAMACGTPVVCSNRGGLPEVAGDAALQVEPESTRALAEAIARVLTDPGLAKEMSAKGLRQAAQFTWERTAKEILKVYLAALSPDISG